MNEMQIHDKVFQTFITEEKINETVIEIAKRINNDYSDKNPVLVGVLNGAFIFLADLVRALNCAPKIGFIAVSSYGDAMKSSGKLSVTMPLNINVINQNVLVVEDIVDAGHTTEWLRNYLSEQGAKSVKVATLLFKPDAFQGKNEPEYCGIKIANDFVVGYGLDYAGQGREIREILKLKS